MSRTLRGLAVLAIGVGAWACKGDPQSALRGDAALVVASPASLFLQQGISELVTIEVVDDQGNQLSIPDFALTSNNAGITVAEDSGYNYIYDASGVATRPSPWTRARYVVTGSAFVSTTLTASGGGVSLDLPARVVPATDLAFGISDLAPPLGDTLTFTAAAGTHFTDSSSVTFASGPAPIVVSIDPTGATMRILPGPNTNGPATVTNVQVNFDPSLVFTVTSTDAVVNPTITDLGDPFNTTTPALGQTLTMTMPTGFVFQTSSTVTFPDAPAPIIQGLSPDSTVLSMLVPPNMDTLAVVTDVIHERLPQFPLTLFTTVNVVTPVVANFAATLAPDPAAVGDTVVITAGAGFLFDPTATATFPSGNVDLVGISADSTTMSVVLQPDVADVRAPLTITGVLSSGFALTLPTADSVTQTKENFSGTDDDTAPPAITIPSSGNTVTITDGGPFGGGTFAANDSRFYSFTLAGPTTFDFSGTWTSTADLGFYFIDAGFTTILDAADNFGGGAGGQPETATVTLPAGTYILAVVLFDPDPAAFTMVISTQ